MNSAILNRMGIAEFDPAYLIFAGVLLWMILFIWIIVVTIKQKKMIKKYEAFMKGSNGKSLEEAVRKKFAQIEELVHKDEEKELWIKKIEENLVSVYQKTGIVKYDAFNEMGGKLSFAIALLDKENNGFVINAMHSREGCYIYIKEIIKGKSYILLGEEEQQALDKAMNSEFDIDYID